MNGSILFPLLALVISLVSLWVVIKQDRRNKQATASLMAPTPVIPKYCFSPAGTMVVLTYTRHAPYHVYETLLEYLHDQKVQLLSPEGTAGDYGYYLQLRSDAIKRWETLERWEIENNTGNFPQPSPADFYPVDPGKTFVL